MENWGKNGEWGFIVYKAGQSRAVLLYVAFLVGVECFFQVPIFVGRERVEGGWGSAGKEGCAGTVSVTRRCEAVGHGLNKGERAQR